MRYCPVCDNEYRDDVATCRDDGSILLDRAGWEEELRRQGRAPLQEGVRVIAVFDTPFEAEQIADALAEEGIEVAVIPSKAPTVEPLTVPVPMTWRLHVPAHHAERAARLAAEWRQSLETPEAEREAEASARAEEKAGEEGHPT